MSENVTTTDILADQISEATENAAWDYHDLEFVLFCFLLCAWLLFYLAGSPHILGLFAKLILKRFILSKLSILEQCTFDVGTVSIAWLSGTIFAHKIEIRTQQFVILIVESRLSFFWWNLPNNIRSNDSFKELVDENKPHRLQLKLVGVECILYANKARFEALRKIVDSQRFDQSKQTLDPSTNDNDIIIETGDREDAHKSPSHDALKPDNININISQNKNNVTATIKREKSLDIKINDEDDLDDVSLGDVPTISVDQQQSQPQSLSHQTRQQSVTVSLQENTGFLTMKKNTVHSDRRHGPNALFDEFRKGIEGVAPNLFFDLCPVTRIGLESVCIVIGNLNVENYLVGSFRESEMVFFTKRNDPESSMHPFKYSVCGKMWDLNVAFHKNDDFKHDLVHLMTAQNTKPRSRIAPEADYITDSMYLLNKLLTNRNTDKNAEHSSYKTRRNRKDKNIQIGPLTQESLTQNESNVPNFDKMRVVQEHAAMSRASSGADSSKKSKRSKASKRSKRSRREKEKKSRSSKSKKRGGDGKENKKKRLNSASSKTKTMTTMNAPNSYQASNEGAPYNSSHHNTGRPPSIKTGGSSVTTNDDQKTFVTHSSHYTHSSQRSHFPYAAPYGSSSNRGSVSHRHQSSHHHSAAGTIQGVHTSHVTDTGLSNSGEDANWNTNTNGNALEMAESQISSHQKTLNIPMTSTTSITSQRRGLKISTEVEKATSGSPHGSTGTASTPPATGGFMPRMQSEASQRTMILEDAATESAVSGQWNIRNQMGRTLAPPTVTTEQSSQLTGSGNDDSTVQMPFRIKGAASSGNGESDTEYESDEDEEEDPDTTVIITTESFSFFFQRDSPATLTAEHERNHLREDCNEEMLPKQQLDVVVHHQCEVNYGPYADDLRAKLMANFLPFMYQHRETTPLIPRKIGDPFNFRSLDISIRFDEPRFPMQQNVESYSDTTSSSSTRASGGSNVHGNSSSRHQRLKPGQFSPSNAKYNVPWFILNIPFSANIDDEAKQMMMDEEQQHRDNHHMQIKFGAHSQINVSIPWMVLETECADATSVQLELTPCNISSSIRKSDLYHSIIDTDRFVMNYRWTTPLRWNGLQKHDIEVALEKKENISSIYFLSEHINVFRSLSTDWMSYRPEVSIEYFVPSTTSIRLQAKESQIVTSINEFNVIHIESPSKFSFLQKTPSEFLDNPANARLKWKGIVEMELLIPSTDWKPSVSNMKLSLEMRIAELFLELPSQHPFTDCMPTRKKDDEWCQCLKFRTAKLEMDYLYHNIYYREHRDSMNLSIDVRDPEFKVYGHIFRYYWNFIENYSSVFSEFLTMEEVQSESV